MLRGTNLEYAKAYNLRIVLETVRLHGPLSRAEVARRTALTPQTISNIVTRLLERGLVKEAGTKQGKVGSPSTQLEFNAHGAFSIGFDLDQKHLTGVLIDLNGVVYRHFRQSVNFPSPAEALELMATVATTFSREQAAENRVLGVGVAFPGPIRVTERAVVDNFVNPDFFPGWENVPVARQLSDLIRLPVLLENNATAAAIGESFYGVGQGIANFFYVFLGTGLGGGVVLNGQPYHGQQGNAGEIGFIPVGRDKGAVTRLGIFFNLPWVYRRLAAQGVHAAAPQDLGALLERKNAPLSAWLDELAGHLADALIGIEFSFDPEAVIFGGVWPEPLIDALLARLETLLPPLRLAQKGYQPRLIRAEAGEDAAALGVATLPIYAAFAPNTALLAKSSSAPELPVPVERR